MDEKEQARLPAVDIDFPRAAKAESQIGGAPSPGEVRCEYL